MMVADKHPNGEESDGGRQIRSRLSSEFRREEKQGARTPREKSLHPIRRKHVKQSFGSD